MLDIQFGQASDFGKVRTNNEDAMGSFVPASRHQARSHGFLFADADGVGGLDLGEVASATAIQVVTEGFAKAPPGAMLPSLMPRLIEQANAAVHDCSLQPQYRGKKMATTLVACALRYDQAVIGHVGDSRCYLVRNGQVRLLLVRSIGTEMFVAPDISTHTAQPGDVFILCSDGMHDETPESEIARIVTQKKPMDEITRELVARAVEIDGGDNTTAQVIRVRAVEQVGMYRGRPYRLPSM